MQEAFFGHDLLLTSRTEPTPEMPSEDEEDSAPGRPEANMIVLEALQDPSEDAPSDSGAPSPAARTGSKGVSPALQDEGTSTPVKVPAPSSTVLRRFERGVHFNASQVCVAAVVTISSSSEFSKLTSC